METPPRRALAQNRVEDTGYLRGFNRRLHIQSIHNRGNPLRKHPDPFQPLVLKTGHNTDQFVQILLIDAAELQKVQ